MSLSDKDVTTLLLLASQGDRHAQDELFRRVEAELRKKARARLSREVPGPGMQTTMLIDEAFLKLVADQSSSWENRSQFYQCAARVMREILVDHARQRNAQKRGGNIPPASLQDVPDPQQRPALDPLTVLALHEALSRLAVTQPELVQIVELHIFGGWELQQIADDILRISHRTIKRRWQLAKAMLHREISGDQHDT